MQTLQVILTVFHLVISVALIIIVLMQQGKQQGLSGAIAGGAETFFGKNKGRTMDAMLKRFTTVVAALFIITSIVLSLFINSLMDAEESIGDYDMNELLQMQEDGGMPFEMLDEDGNPIEMPEMDDAQVEVQPEDGTEAETDGETDTETTEAAAE